MTIFIIKLKGEKNPVRIFHPAHGENLLAAYKASLDSETTIRDFPAYRVDMTISIKKGTSYVKFVFHTDSLDSYDRLLRISIS